MTMKTTFLERMKEYLKDEYEAFEKTLDHPMYKGLSINTLKTDADYVIQNLPVCLQKSPFSKNGYLFDAHEKLGNHWMHQAGLFYLQEPSASSVVDALEIQENDWVLDACAAPGGKSFQIACALNNTGLLLSNEMDMKRAQVLMSNMERCGISENIITCSPIEKLTPYLQACFDKILVDAPCSGEGMMKKHELASLEWSVENNRACGVRQLRILESVAGCLKQGGILVYSTCTYAIEENEAVIHEFLARHPEMELMDGGSHVQRKGLPYKDLDVSKVRRIYPMDGGEGHFFAKMRKKEETKSSSIKILQNKKIEPCAQKFLLDQGCTNWNLMQIQQKVYMKKGPFLNLKVPVLRQGILVGEVVKNRFEPHHHFYTAAQLKHDAVVEMNDEQMHTFMSGNVIVSDKKGYLCMQYHHFPIGFGKGDGNQIKNKYPKGLRMDFIK